MLDTRVKDWSTENKDPSGLLSSERSYRSLFASIQRFVLSVAAIWVLLFLTQKFLPYVQNGAAAVGSVKKELAVSAMFGPADRIRTLSFGNSKTLAGFEPSVFEAELGSGVRSFNLAIPGDDRFVDLLEAALSHGNTPTQILVQMLPDTRSSDSLWEILLDNKRMINLLFPFREYARDAVIFGFESATAGGPVKKYRSNAAQIEKLRSDRGYYFIKSQSHYSGDRLPDDFSLPTDRPNEVFKRLLRPGDPAFIKLMGLAEKYDFKVVLVPVAYRRGQYAVPPETDSEMMRLLASYPHARVIGPAYWLYAPDAFSDPVHLNPDGAERYTKELAALFQTYLSSER